MVWSGHSVLLLAGVLLAVGAVLAAAVVILMAWSLLRPPRMTDGKAAWLLRRLSPGDLGMPYEDLSFVVRDTRTGEALRMAAWWIAAEGKPPEKSSNRCVLLLHGYADAKVGVIAWAPLWRKLGFNILAPDLRAHGESGGRQSTAGYYERHDVDQVISQLRAQRPNATRHVVLFGASLGATVATAAAALRDDLAALVLESPIADFRSAATTHMDLLGLPGRPLQAVALRLAEWLAYARFDEVNTIALLRSVRCPALVIAPSDDLFLGPQDLRTFQEVLSTLPYGRLWRVEGTTHLLGVQADAEAYSARLREFLDAALAASPTGGGLDSANPAPAGVNAGGGAV